MPNRYAQRVQELKGEPIGSSNAIPSINVSEERIREMEHQLGVSLPADYREFILDYSDYGFFEGVIFPVKPNSSYIEGALERVYGAASTYKNPDWSLINVYHGYCEIPVWQRNWLPIAEAGRDDRIVLSIAGEDKGDVYLFVAHLLATGTQFMFPVANSFDEFMQMLTPSQD